MASQLSLDADTLLRGPAFDAHVAALKRDLFGDLEPRRPPHDEEEGEAAAPKTAAGAPGDTTSRALAVVAGARRAREGVAAAAAGPAPPVQPSVPAASNALVAVDPDLLRAQAEQKRRELDATDTPIRPRWKIDRVCVGHQGRVTSVAFDPSNEWFATGSADASVKAWNLVSGKCMATLTGHKAGVEGVCVSQTAPYLFSAGQDKIAKCWDLETNTVVRDYFGHLSTIHCIAAHPMQDLIVTGGRDATVRVWDVRTRREVHVMQGHSESVLSVATQGSTPQVISGGADGFIYFWDLASGRAITRLTRHKKPVRALAVHATENTFVSVGADNVRKWRLPTGEFMANLVPEAGHKNDGARWTSAAVSPRDVLVVGADGDGGAMDFFDYPSSRLFRAGKTKSVPGTLPGEAGVLGAAFDQSGTRLITAEGDKTVKFWSEVAEGAAGEAKA